MPSDRIYPDDYRTHILEMPLDGRPLRIAHIHDEQSVDWDREGQTYTCPVCGDVIDVSAPAEHL